MSKPIPPFEISIEKIERHQKPSPSFPDGFVVTFFLRRQGDTPSISFPVFVSSEHFDEGDLVRVARHYLHKLAEGLFQQTEKWVLSDEEIDDALLEDAQSDSGKKK